MFNQKYKDKITQLEQENKKLKSTMQHLNNNNIKDSQDLTNNILESRKKLRKINDKIVKERSNLINLQNQSECQDVGWYEIKHNLDTSDEYKIKLSENKKKQKEFIKGLKCMIVPEKDTYHFNNNYASGNRMINLFSRLVLENFNLTCDKFLAKITFNNCSDIVINMLKLYDKLNDKVAMLDISIKREYLDLKIEEAELNAELQVKLEEEKEAKRYQSEILKDELKAENELKKQRKKLEDDLTKAKYEYNKLHKKNKDLSEIETKISNLESELDKNEYWLTHKKAGYVYVVSNSDMKEGQYKIGITRRSIEERMKELGSGASHSFQMNVHASVFVSDVFKVESDVHNFLEDKRVNRSNARKEWFYCTLDEVKEAFKSTNGILLNIDNSLDVYDPNYIYSKNYFDFL